MNATVAISRRELAEKKFVFIAAVAFAVLPLIMTAIPGLHFGKTGLLLASAVDAAGFAAALSVVLGAGFIGRDIADGRMSFYFSRPLGTGAIWFGKLGAALLIIAVSFVIIFLPAYLAGSGRWTNAFTADLPVMLAGIIGGCLALFLVSHVIGTFVRSRSAWIGLDFVVAVLLGVAIRAMLRPLFLGQAVILGWRVVAGLAIGIAAAIIGGGAFQLARGRTDRVRSHLALSQFLWVAAGVVVAIAGAFVWWVFSATPQDLTTIHAQEQSSRGGAAILVGQARNRADYPAAFLIDPATGAFERIHPSDWYYADFVARGAKLLEIVRSTKSGSADVFLRDARPHSPRFDPRITVTARWDSRVAVSDDARQMAVIDGGSLSVYDLASRRSLGTVQISQALGRIHAMFFPSPNLVRLYLLPQQGACLGCVPQGKPRTISILEFDASRRQLVQTGGTQATGRYVRLAVSSDGSRMVVRTGEIVSFHDARSGVALPSPVIATGEQLGYATTFLQDGGVAVAVETGKQFQIRIFNPDGSPRRSIPLGEVRRVWPIREIAPGKLLAGASNGDGANGRWEAVSLDVATGEILRREPNLRPTFGDGLMWWNGTDPRRGLIDPAQLYDLGTKGLVRWNALTGAKNIVVPGA